MLICQKAMLKTANANDERSTPMTTSEPTTGENRDTECAIRALNTIAMVSPQWNGAIKVAIDRLESQERDLETLRAFHERYAEQTSKQYVVAVCGLTARAEQAEKERDAAIADIEHDYNIECICNQCEHGNDGSCHHTAAFFGCWFKYDRRGQPQDGEGL